jgi:hypothetical protein
MPDRDEALWGARWRPAVGQLPLERLREGESPKARGRGCLGRVCQGTGLKSEGADRGEGGPAKGGRGI